MRGHLFAFSSKLSLAALLVCAATDARASINMDCRAEFVWTQGQPSPPSQTVRIGASRNRYRIMSSDSDRTWISLQEVPVTDPTQLLVEVKVTPTGRRSVPGVHEGGPAYGASPPSVGGAIDNTGGPPCGKVQVKLTVLAAASDGVPSTSPPARVRPLPSPAAPGVRVLPGETPSAETGTRVPTGEGDGNRSTPAGTPSTEKPAITQPVDSTALSFEPAMLEFVFTKGGPLPGPRTVLVRNAGASKWSSDSWVKVGPNSWVDGGLAMQVSVDPANLEARVHEGKVQFTSNGKTITLPVKLTITDGANPPAPAPSPAVPPSNEAPAITQTVGSTELTFEPALLEFVFAKGGPLPGPRTVLVRNAGGYEYSSDFWLKVGPNPRWVDGGLEMQVSIDPANLEARVHEGQLRLTSIGRTITLPVKLTITGAPEPPGTLPPPTPTPTPTLSSTPTPTPTPAVESSSMTFEPARLKFVFSNDSRTRALPQSVFAKGLKAYSASISHGVVLGKAQWVKDGAKFDVSYDPGAFRDVGTHPTNVTFVSEGQTIVLPIDMIVVSSKGTLQVNRKQVSVGGVLGQLPAGQVIDLTYSAWGDARWSAKGPDWLSLEPFAGSVSAEQPASLRIGVNEKVVSAATRRNGTVVISDGRTSHEIEVRLSVVEPGAPTVELVGLEVTQGLQNLLNDIPFVAKRPAFVRAHVQSLTGGPKENVSATLVGTRDGTDLGSLDPINPGGAITVSSNPDRAKLDDSLLFQLPEEWRTGAVKLRLVGKGEAIACMDPGEGSVADAKPHDCTVSLEYQTIPSLPVTYVLYSESVGRTTYVADHRTATAVSGQLLAGLPIPEVDQRILSPGQSFSKPRLTSDDNSTVLGYVRDLYAKAGEAESRRHYYGLFSRYDEKSPDTPVQGGPGGLAAVPGFAGMGEYYPFQPMGVINMHEIGHNLGRSHVNCGGPRNPDPNFPHKDSRISDETTGEKAYYGFNILTKEIHPPTTYDYMSYCHPSWASPYTYKAMMERLKIHYGPDKAAAPSNQTGAAPGSPIVIISGSLRGFSGGSIDRVIGDTANGALPAEPASPYSLQLLDLNGQPLAKYPVRPQVAEGQGQFSEVTYTLAVPRPENLGRAVLQYSDQVLADRKASANDPAVRLMGPIGGERLKGEPLTIRWEASDADGDALIYNVDYSTDDGVSWRAITRGWNEKAIEINSARLPGSTTARIRVAANDGFRTTFAVSEVFEVADQPPVASILTTAVPSQFVPGQIIMLEGSGYDLEDGMLRSLSWYSDRDGHLGNGPTLAVHADRLSEGPHQIRVEAKDSKGQSARSEAIRFAVSKWATETPSVPVTLFDEPGFAGKSQGLSEGMTSGFLAMGNDLVSSVRVSPCFKVTLFEHVSGQGREVVLTSDARDLRDHDFDNVVSSVKVERDASCQAPGPVELPASFKVLAFSISQGLGDQDPHWLAVSAGDSRGRVLSQAKLGGGAQWMEMQSVDLGGDVYAFKVTNAGADMYLTVRDNREVHVDPAPGGDIPDAAKFRSVSPLTSAPGAQQRNFRSFQSVKFPGDFLRHSGLVLFVQPADGSELFRQDASWLVEKK